MEKTITRVIVEKHGSTILDKSLPVAISRAELRRAFFSLHLDRALAFSVNHDRAAIALVTIL